MRKAILLTATVLSLQMLFAQGESVRFKNDFYQGKNVSRTEEKQRFLRNDFSRFWTQTANEHVLGFIGTNYQRFYIKFLSISKDATDPSLYHVSGKDRVKTNICDFTGTFRILGIRRNTEYDEIMDEGMKTYCILFSYTLKEDPKQKFTGTFEGFGQTNIYVDAKGVVHYIDMPDSPEFSNNGFVGGWKSYDGRYNKPCHWGDTRIPYSGKLDEGTSLFFPAEAFIKNGWENYAACMGNDEKAEKANAIEKAAWWK